ncbi:hypothetical protein J4G65_13025 [Aeromonas allosaccharophila]|uniref:hypothetical protein n=1 Tax=Aeromonas allosaccharophila TaxID=656 RepID=UPI001BCCBED6|nr:hypothetical protein [Aeromonas allosaccharophila]MBS4696384.1 hypothetical protein [Aeromonas allosaccharophila]
MWGRFLNLKHTGKILSAFHTLFASAITFYAMDYFKSQMQSDNPTFPVQLVIAIIIAFTAVMGMLRDYINEDLNMQSPLNKEKNAHEDTKLSLTIVKDELEDKKKIIHAITSNINNTLISSAGSREAIQQLRDIMTKVNKEECVHNINNVNLKNKKLDNDSLSVKNYLKLFSCD